MTSTPTIFISAYRNFSVRYILYSDIFRVLKNSGARIVVFLRDNDLEYYRDRLGGRNVVFEPVLFEAAMRETRRGRIRRLLVITRKCISGSASGYKNTSNNLRLYQYRTEMVQGPKGWLEFQFVRALSALGRKFHHVRVGLVAFESWLFPGRMYDSYFERYNPQMFIISSLGYMIDPLFMRAAKRHGCKVVSVIHNWDNPSTKDYRGAVPDWVIAWNETMKREVNVFHDIPNENIHVGGVAHWDLYFNGRFSPRPKEEFLQSNGLSPERMIILYGASDLRAQPRSFEVIEEVLQAINEDRFSSPAQLLVRMHPTYLLGERGGKDKVVGRYRNWMDNIEAIKERYGDLVSFVPPAIKVLNDDIDVDLEDTHRLAEILFHSDVLLTEYSTLNIEAAIFDLPVVNLVLYNWWNTPKPAAFGEAFFHVQRLLNHGAATSAYNFDELLEYIEFYLQDRRRQRQERENLVNEMVSTNRGSAGEAIGKLLVSFLRGEPGAFQSVTAEGERQGDERAAS